jgi:hypothetical protein
MFLIDGEFPLSLYTVETINVFEVSKCTVINIICQVILGKLTHLMINGGKTGRMAAVLFLNLRRQIKLVFYFRIYWYSIGILLV